MFSTFWGDVWSAEIVNHLWQSTLVVFVAWILTLALRRYQARVRYWVWMAASLKFLLPFSLLAAVGGWLRPASAPSIERSLFAGAVARAEQPFAASAQSAGSFMMWFPGPASPISAPRHELSLFEVLLTRLCGVLFLLFRWLRSWWELRTTVRWASLESWPIDVPVFVTPRMIEPGVVGLFRPVLLLPAQILKRLPKAQLHAILAHERCHVERRDNLTGAIHLLVETLFWFHPAVWWIERHLIEERERACDETVLISNHGGAQARWRADGKELFYITMDKKLMAVAIDTSHDEPIAGVPHVLFQTRIIAPRIALFQYAVSPDGSRFLINSMPSVGAAPLTVLMN